MPFATHNDVARARQDVKGFMVAGQCSEKLRADAVGAVGAVEEMKEMVCGIRWPFGIRRRRSCLLQLTSPKAAVYEAFE